MGPTSYTSIRYKKHFEPGMTRIPGTDPNFCNPRNWGLSPESALTGWPPRQVENLERGWVRSGGFLQ